MRIVSIVGNRPQFVKAAPLSRALRRRAEEVLVHSGQHYDPELADLFFDELEIPRPDHALGVGPGSPTTQLAVMLQRLEPLLDAEAPDLVMVYGDTTTTLAGALAAAKAGLPLGHVEAGLRSFDRSMPEEQNRLVADHLSALLFCPTDAAVANLAAEGIAEGVVQVGDVMLDASRLFAPAAAARPGPAALGLEPGGYLLVTVHRAAATDTPEALEALVALLTSIGEPMAFPVHPRTRHRLEAAGMWDRLAAHGPLRLTPPVGYLDFTALLVGARAVMTDSGGVQKEAYFHGVPCLTLRETTEWVETVEGGFNRLVGMDPARARAALADLAMPAERPPVLRRRGGRRADRRRRRRVGRPSLGDPDGDARVVGHQPVAVEDEHGGEADAGGRVVVARPAALVVDAGVGLLEPLDGEAGGAHPGRGRLGPVADAQRQPAHGERVGERRRLEVDVEAPLEVRRGGAVDEPRAAAVALDGAPRASRRRGGTRPAPRGCGPGRRARSRSARPTRARPRRRPSTPPAATRRRPHGEERLEALARAEVAPRRRRGERVHQISRSKGLGS